MKISLHTFRFLIIGTLLVLLFTFIEYGALTIFRPKVYGLHGDYYSNIEWQGEAYLTSLDTSISSHTLKIQREKLPQNRFSVEWAGYINIPKTDTYTFYTKSDDGSWLTIDDTLVVDNGGAHGLQEVQGKIRLSKGLHKITIRYFQIGGHFVLHVLWATPQGLKLPLTAEFLFPPTINPANFWIYQTARSVLPFLLGLWGLLSIGIGVAAYVFLPELIKTRVIDPLEHAQASRTLAVVRYLQKYWAGVLVILSGFVFGSLWKMAQITLIAPEVKRLYPLHLYADSAIRTGLLFVMIWLVCSYVLHRLLGIKIGTALKVDAVGFVAITLMFLFYDLFLDFRVVHPAIGRVFLLSKLLYFFFVPYKAFWERVQRRKDYLVDILLILLLFSLIFMHVLPPDVDKFLYWRDGGTIALSWRTTLVAVNAIRYFDIHLWDSFMNAGSTPFTFWSTIQYHPLGLLDFLLGFTSFDYFNNHQLGNYFGYLFLSLILFSWISIYLFLRRLGFSRFSSYFLGLAYPFIGIFQFIDFETIDVYQALIFPFLALCMLWMLQTKTVVSALWVSLITVVFVHYVFYCAHPAFFSHTYLFLIGWIGYMIISYREKRIRYSLLLFTFLGSHLLLFMPKLLAVSEFAPRLSKLAPHGYKGTLTNYFDFGSLYHNMLRFFYFWAQPESIWHVRKWYYMLTPVTFLFLTGMYVLWRRQRPQKQDIKGLSILYFLGYAILYFFFQLILEPSLIQAWIYRIHQITLLHYSFNTAPTFTVGFLVIAAIGLDWFMSHNREDGRAYVPFLVFNALLLITGILFLRYPTGLDALGLEWKDGMAVDSQVIGHMLFIIISTNIIIYLLRGLTGYSAFRNIIVTVVFVIYISHILQSHLKYAKFIDSSFIDGTFIHGTPDKECETPLKYYAYYLKNNTHDMITYRQFREKARRILHRDMLERTESQDMSDDYFNEIILNRNLYPPPCIPSPQNRLSLAQYLALPFLEWYHTQPDYRYYRYSAADFPLAKRAYTPFANSFPFFLEGWNPGFVLIPREMKVFNDGAVTLNLEYHLNRPYLMDMLGVKYLYVSRKAYDEHNLDHSEKLKLLASLGKYKDKAIMFLENTTAKPIAYIASGYRLRTNEERRLLTDKEYRLLTDEEKVRYTSQLCDTPLDPNILLLESNAGIPFPESTGDAQDTLTLLPPVEIVNARFNWAVFRVKGNPKANLLFHSDSYDKSWNGYVDRKKVNIYRAQLAFKAVVVPPGDHLVWFEYRPGCFVYGVYIFCLTTIGILLFAIRKEYNQM